MQLQIQNLSKKYNKENALFNITTTLTPGNLIGLIGPNGAGKSTLMQILATLIKPTNGTVFLNDQNIVKNPYYMRQILGYLPQQVAVYPNLTAQEFLSYMAAMKKIPKEQAEQQIPFLLEKFHLTPDSNKYLSDFSGGMKQRVGLSCALLGFPQILIVDEPTAGLDPEERINVRNILSEYARNHIVILSTHVISDIEAIASRLLILKMGILLFDGNPEELMKQASGHVWEYKKPTGYDVSKLSGVSSILQQSDHIKLRQVSLKKPCDFAYNVEPTLEDACLYELEVSL